MAIIKKVFVQAYVSYDCEGRCWNWEDTDEKYEDLKNKLMTEWNGWFKGARIVEKTFDDETFAITVKPLKTAYRVYKHLCWVKGEIDEKEG